MDKDEKGTILSVIEMLREEMLLIPDILLLVIGFIFCLVSKNSRFRYLAHRLNELRLSGKTLVFTGSFGFLLSIFIC